MKNLNEPLKSREDVVRFEPRSATEKERIENETTGSLLPGHQMDDLRGRWTTIQSSFVDEPRKAVEEADHLVQQAIKQLEDGFSAERANLERQWSKGDQVSTEDLRVCLQHYRSFFDRLLSGSISSNTQR